MDTHPRTSQQQRQPRIARSSHLTETEKLQLAIRWALLPQNSRGDKIGVGELEVRSMVAPGYVRKHLNIPKLLGARPDAAPLQRKLRMDAGVPRKLTPVVMAKLAEKAQEWNWVFTFNEMADQLREDGVADITGMAICNYAVDNGWNCRARGRTVPLLTDRHREWRKEWAGERVDEDWAAWVDLDEKWFYALAPWRTHKLPPDVPVPLNPVQHKSHIPKTMFLCALGRPRFAPRADGQQMVSFNGKLGCWRISEPYTAKRDSKNHEKGDVYEKDVTMNAERYVKLMTEKVLPAIAAKYRTLGVKKVIVQHDGAPPHVGKGAESEIDKFGATLNPPIEIIRQPSQSPDTNICDIAFFRALASCVAKRRRGIERGKIQFDLERLADDVEAAFNAYSANTLDQMWAYKSELMKKIVEADGGNWYDKRSNRLATGQKRARA